MEILDQNVGMKPKSGPKHVPGGGSLPAKARVLVVEDNLFVRQGIIAMINRQPDLVCCGETDGIASTPSLVIEHKPDLVLLDLRLKDGESFGLVAALKLEWPEIPVLMLSQCDETFYAEKALQAGARGYVMKQRAVDDLLGAIRTVLGGEVYLSREMTTYISDKAAANLKSQPLLPRQYP